MKHEDTKNIKAQIYNWSVVSYQPFNELEYALSKASKFAYILHDYDVDEDGLLRSPHYHLLLHFNSHVSFNVLKQYLNKDKVSGQNNFAQEILDKKKMYEYLTHINYPDKYQYSESLIQTNSRSFWTYEKEEKNYLELLEDLEHMTMRQMAIKWGRDFIINYKKYKEFAHDMRVEEEHIKNEQFRIKHNLQQLSIEDTLIIDKLNKL